MKINESFRMLFTRYRLSTVESPSSGSRQDAVPSFSFVFIRSLNVPFGARLLMVLMIISCAGCSSITEMTPQEEKVYTASEQHILKKLHDIIIPELTFCPPETIIDAVDFFKRASRDYDQKEIPLEQRGLSFIVKLSDTTSDTKIDGNIDPFSKQGEKIVPVIPTMTAHSICMWDALKMVCDATGMKFYVCGYWVWIVPLAEPIPVWSNKTSVIKNGK